MPTSAPSCGDAASRTGSWKKHAVYAQSRQMYGRRKSIWQTAHCGYSSCGQIGARKCAARAQTYPASLVRHVVVGGIARPDLALLQLPAPSQCSCISSKRRVQRARVRKVVAARKPRRQRTQPSRHGHGVWRPVEAPMGRLRRRPAPSGAARTTPRVRRGAGRVGTVAARGFEP